MDGKFTKSTTYFGFQEFHHRVITIHQQYTFPLLFPNQCTRSFPFPLCVDLIHNCHQLWPFPKTYPGSSSIINGTSSYPGPSTLPSGASSYRRSSDFLPSVSFYPVASSPMALPIQDSLSGPLSYPGSSSILFGYPSPVKSMSKSTSRPPRVPNPYMCPANPSPLKSRVQVHFKTFKSPEPLRVSCQPSSIQSCCPVRPACPSLPSPGSGAASQGTKPGTQVAGCLTRLAGAPARPHRPRPHKRCVSGDQQLKGRHSGIPLPWGPIQDFGWGIQVEYDRKLGLEKGSSLVTNDGEGTRGAWYIFVSVISTWKLLYVFFFSFLFYKMTFWQK